MKSAMNLKSRVSRMMTFMLSMLLISAVQLRSQAPAPAYVELDATQLDQMVAPIALDPDSLVAQILTASTYPDQVTDADSWLNQHMNQPPDQRAAGANNMSWDPAVKGLIEFPAELDMLVKNSAWTGQLGNAYYNQPGDVMNAVQAMRLQAQQSNVLVTTVQQRVVVEAGVIEIVPVNQALIYVPYYNPWHVWGTLFVAYPGFVVVPPPTGIVWAAGLAFDPGIAIGVYASYGWGFSAWAPAWDGGTVLFNNSTYISNSVTVVNHGYFGGHDRGVFEHGGRGVPNGYRASAHAGAARARAGRAMAGRGNTGRGSFGKPNAGRSNVARSSNAHGGMNASRSANAGRGASASHGATTASRGGSSFGHGSTTANRGSSTNRGSASANRNTTASRGGTSNHGTASANRSTTASRGTSANRSNATANRVATNASRNTAASRGASSNSSAASANRSSASANRGAASANRSSSAANHGSASASRGSTTANRGGASASHSSGGHSSGGRGKGR
jgi:hypothetical protein